MQHKKADLIPTNLTGEVSKFVFFAVQHASLLIMIFFGMCWEIVNLLDPDSNNDLIELLSPIAPTKFLFFFKIDDTTESSEFGLFFSLVLNLI